MLIGLDKAMTPFDFGLKVSRVTCKKMYTWFPLIILRTFYHMGFIFHMLISLHRDMIHIDIEVIRSKVKVKMITFVK